jgi:malonyl-CoA O-methyltransferase
MAGQWRGEHDDIPIKTWCALVCEPVMDMERITLTYETPERLPKELRELAAMCIQCLFVRGFRNTKWKPLWRSNNTCPGQSRKAVNDSKWIYGMHSRSPKSADALSVVSVSDMRSMFHLSHHAEAREST